MTWLAISLYVLGFVGAVAAVSKAAPMGLREYVVIIVWPIAVAAAICLGLFTTVRRACRP
jgi:hypothetical protein